jgi:hypothetical protein
MIMSEILVYMLHFVCLCFPKVFIGYFECFVKFITKLGYSDFLSTIQNVSIPLKNNGCFTRGGTRHFINNSDTNKDIAAKFGVDLPQFMRNLVTS